MSKDEYLKAYPQMLVFGDGQFKTGGYAPAFVEDWINQRISAGEIVQAPCGNLEFSAQFVGLLKSKMAEFQ
jgi:hypothetical protein